MLLNTSGLTVSLNISILALALGLNIILTVSSTPFKGKSEIALLASNFNLFSDSVANFFNPCINAIP